jgi:hypothetical protein
MEQTEWFRWMLVDLRISFSRVFLLVSFLNECITLANCMTDIIVHGKAISNLNDDCRDVTNRCIELYTNYQAGMYK